MAQPNKINIKISDEVLKGHYANGVQSYYTNEEFVLDFMNIYPPHGVVHSRIMVTPSHMKRIVSHLSKIMAQYEEKFGKIKETNAPVTPAASSTSDRSFGFGE